MPLPDVTEKWTHSLNTVAIGAAARPNRKQYAPRAVCRPIPVLFC